MWSPIKATGVNGVPVQPLELVSFQYHYWSQQVLIAAIGTNGVPVQLPECGLCAAPSVSVVPSAAPGASAIPEQLLE